MNIVRHRPAAPLSTWVDCFWYSASDPGRATARRHSALPTGGMDVVFNLDDDCLQVLLPPQRAAVRTNGAIVHGAQSGYFIIDARPTRHSAGIHFRPGCGALLLGVPANELSDLHVSLSDLWGTTALQLRERLLECRSPRQIFQLLEQTLLLRLSVARPARVHPAVRFALQRFANSIAVDRIAPVQQATGYSARRFTTLFQQAVGLPPKRYCRIQRLRSVVEQLTLGASIDWAQLAAANGYFDQSHLNRDFRDFSGVTPGQYRPASHGRALHMDVE